MLFSRSVRSDFATPGMQHPRLPCLSPSQVHAHWVNDAIQPSHPLLMPSPPVLNLFQNQSLSIELALHIRWQKYWSFSINISPSSEHSVLISFRIDWLHLLAVQGTLKSLHQYHNSKASILWHSPFFMVQFSHPYTTIVLSVRTFVSKVMSLLLICYLSLSQLFFQGARVF